MGKKLKKEKKVEDKTDKQTDNSSRPWLWKKGQSGNLKGRPPGKSLKEYTREMLSKMTDKERDEWLEGLNKIDVWKMTEGLPSQHTDITSGGKPLYIPAELIGKNDLDDKSSQSTEPNSK